MLCTTVLYHCRDWWNISEGIFPWTTVLLFNKYNKLIILFITSTQHLSIYLSLWLPPWRYFFSLSDPNSRAILWYCCLIRCPRTRVNAIESEVIDLELSCLKSHRYNLKRHTADCRRNLCTARQSWLSTSRHPHQLTSSLNRIDHPMIWRNGLIPIDNNMLVGRWAESAELPTTIISITGAAPTPSPLT